MDVSNDRQKALERVLEALERAECVLLTTHINADGDGCGSEVAAAAWLRARGTPAWIVNPTPYPDTYRFLVPDPAWVIDAAGPDVRRVAGEADTALVLDTGEVPRIGRVKPLTDGKVIVVVDHHPPGERPIEGVELRAPEACATGELVHDLIRLAGGPWPRAAVDALYVAVLTDTGGFRFSNATAACHRVTADLIERGADPERLYREVYGSLPLNRLRLLRHALATLEVDDEGRVAWMTVPPDAFQALELVPEDLEGIVDYPRAVEGVEVGLLFRTTVGGGTKVSFRSNGEVDVNALARQFGGGGHVRAAGALIEGPLEEVRPRVIEATRRAVRETLGPVARVAARREPEPGPVEAGSPPRKDDEP